MTYTRPFAHQVWEEIIKQIKETEVQRLYQATQVAYMSRTWCDRLSGAAAGAAVTLATMWLILLSAAAATIILRV